MAKNKLTRKQRLGLEEAPSEATVQESEPNEELDAGLESQPESPNQELDTTDENSEDASFDQESDKEAEPPVESEKPANAEFAAARVQERKEKEEIAELKRQVAQMQGMLMAQNKPIVQQEPAKPEFDPIAELDPLMMDKEEYNRAILNAAKMEVMKELEPLQRSSDQLRLDSQYAAWNSELSGYSEPVQEKIKAIRNEVRNRLMASGAYDAATIDRDIKSSELEAISFYTKNAQMFGLTPEQALDNYANQQAQRLGLQFQQPTVTQNQSVNLSAERERAGLGAVSGVSAGGTRPTVAPKTRAERLRAAGVKPIGHGSPIDY